MIGRREVTDLVISTIRTELGKPVGDATTPEEKYGWSGQAGSPGSIFTPYLIVIPNATNDLKGSLGNTHSDVKFSYTLIGYGASRSQCEWLMDRSRSALEVLRGNRIEIPDGLYTFANIGPLSIGSVNRSGEDDYPHYGQTDVVSVFVSKEHPL